MRRARLTQDVFAVGKSPTEAAATGTDNQLPQSVNCPDCSDILESYDWDKIRYLYENYDLNLQWNFYEDQL
ncbi:MAG: hypothetical protein WBE34_02375 [Candidatus Nitrosopolaris sp.]